MFRLKPGRRVRLRDQDSSWSGGHRDKEEVAQLMERNLKRLTEAQELLWASESYALLIVLQAMDTAGKDGLIRHVMSGVNPQGCYVVPFKQPSSEEMAHDFLWRYAEKMPAKGRIGIFNRSHYEEVLVVRVHPELLEHEHVTQKDGPKLWKQRFDDINEFERHLARNRTVILKFFLHISKREQKKRLLERLDNPDKHWKFSPSDIAEREYWSDYVEAYEEALKATSTEHAPWYILPADHKWVTHWVASEIIAKTIRKLDLKIPPLAPEQEKALARARRVLTKE
ncbi:MAG TPA: polyphosphate kinase 2 family protein [Bryobacteraceae bacterium]|nr:polyphosphate kinase 2 family protein [Bryobacteraceae bacterium]